MKDIFVKSQWDTFWAFLQQGHPPLWLLFLAVNGCFLLLLIYLKASKNRPLRPASVGALRALFILMNIGVLYHDETIRILRSSVDYMPFLDHLM